MTMAQTWTIIGSMIGTLAVMFGMTQRTMSLQSKMIKDALDGHRSELHLGLDGLRNEMHSSIGGLRNEMNARFEAVQSEMNARFEAVQGQMNARFESVEGQLSRLASLDREVHALTLKVFRDEPPDTT